MSARLSSRVGTAAWRAFVAVAIALLMAACAAPPRVSGLENRSDHWSGRLSVRVDSEAAKSFQAGFDLAGNAQQGELLLYSPLGATLAQLQWTPTGALLRSDGQVRRFESIDALTREATGTALPVASIFEWLAGRPVEAAGWRADLGSLADKRLVARRTEPSPPVELRIVLE